MPSDKVLKENAQNHAAVAGCLNILQVANLCKFQTAFSDQVKLNPETNTTLLSRDFANHTISLIPIDAPKAISNIMTTTTPTSPFTEDSVQVTNTEAQNGSSTSAHDQSLSPIFQFPILKASVKKNSSQSSSLHTNKRQPFNKASNFSSLPGAMVSSNSSIIIQSSKVTSHHAQPHPQHCHAPINDSAVPERFHNTQHPPQVNGVPQNYNIASHVPEIEYQPSAIPTHCRPIIQGTTDRQENKTYTELTPMPSTLHTTGQLLSSAVGPVTPERANDSSLTLPSQMPDYQSTPNGRINNYEDKVKQLQQEVEELKKENESLRSELQSLQGASGSAHSCTCPGR